MIPSSVRRLRSLGFTLIELLIVIAIIGVLSSMVFASLNASRQKAFAAQAITQIREYEKALTAYNLDHGYYPATSNPSLVCIGEPNVDTCIYWDVESTADSGVSHRLIDLVPDYIPKLTTVDTGPPTSLEIFPGHVRVYQGATYSCSSFSNNPYRCFVAEIEWPISGSNVCLYGTKILPSSDPDNARCQIILN